MTFDELNLAPDLLRAVREQRYTKPTAIQAQAIPLILQGVDLLAGAQTGTGKTAGFALPMLHLLLKRPVARSGAIRALVLTPTRELAAQVQDAIDVYGKYTSLTSTVIFGGVGQNPQVERINKGVDILVATPGRLLDLHEQGYVNLSNVEILVLDEADRMLDMGFIHDVKKVLALMPSNKQSLLFSATFSNDIRALAASFLKNPLSVQVTPPNTTVDLVAQTIFPVGRENKKKLLVHLIKTRKPKQVLVFTRTKVTANSVADYLNKHGVEAMALHGNKSQSARTIALDDFRGGELCALVATDIAARGIDIDNLPFVVNYDVPNVPEDYVHRIGRTGRAGTPGTAASLVSLDEEGFMLEIERFIGRQVKVEVIAEFAPLDDEQALPILMGNQMIWGGLGKSPGRDVMQSSSRAARAALTERLRGGRRNNAVQFPEIVHEPPKRFVPPPNVRHQQQPDEPRRTISGTLRRPPLNVANQNRSTQRPVSEQQRTTTRDGTYQQPRHGLRSDARSTPEIAPNESSKTARGPANAAVPAQTPHPAPAGAPKPVQGATPQTLNNKVEVSVATPPTNSLSTEKVVKAHVDPQQVPKITPNIAPQPSIDKVDMPVTTHAVSNLSTEKADKTYVTPETQPKAVPSAAPQIPSDKVDAPVAALATSDASTEKIQQAQQAQASSKSEPTAVLSDTSELSSAKVSEPVATSTASSLSTQNAQEAHTIFEQVTEITPSDSSSQTQGDPDDELKATSKAVRQTKGAAQKTTRGAVRSTATKTSAVAKKTVSKATSKSKVASKTTPKTTRKTTSQKSHEVADDLITPSIFTQASESALNDTTEAAHDVVSNVTSNASPVSVQESQPQPQQPENIAVHEQAPDVAPKVAYVAVSVPITDTVPTIPVQKAGIEDLHSKQVISKAVPVSAPEVTHTAKGSTIIDTAPVISAQKTQSEEPRSEFRATSQHMPVSTPEITRSAPSSASYDTDPAISVQKAPDVRYPEIDAAREQVPVSDYGQAPKSYVFRDTTPSVQDTYRDPQKSERNQSGDITRDNASEAGRNMEPGMMRPPRNRGPRSEHGKGYHLDRRMDSGSNRNADSQGTEQSSGQEDSRGPRRNRWRNGTGQRRNAGPNNQANRSFPPRGNNKGGNNPNANPPRQNPKPDFGHEDGHEDDLDFLPSHIDPLQTNLHGRKRSAPRSAYDYGGQPDPTKTSVDLMGKPSAPGTGPRNRGGSNSGGGGTSSGGSGSGGGGGNGGKNRGGKGGNFPSGGKRY
jgi:ATP-dependent RNA helicase RhlE